MDYQKIVLNNAHQPCHFNLSKKALKEIEKIKGLSENTLSAKDFFETSKRTDKDLISVVEDLGDEANYHSRLYITSFPADTEYIEILNYDCMETLQIGYPDDLSYGGVDIVLCHHSLYGPFLLSDLACQEIAKRKNCEMVTSEDFDFGSKFTRYDPDLLYVVKELKEEACGEYVYLFVVHVDDDEVWHIRDYDGSEYIVTFDNSDGFFNFGNNIKG